MTDTFFALFWCLSVNISLSFYYSIILKGSMAFFSGKHCTLPTTLEMSEINNQLLHFPTYYMWSNVLKMSCGKNFLRSMPSDSLRLGCVRRNNFSSPRTYTFKVSRYAPDSYHQLKIHNSL